MPLFLLTPERSSLLVQEPSSGLEFNVCADTEQKSRVITSVPGLKDLQIGSDVD